MSEELKEVRRVAGYVIRNQFLPYREKLNTYANENNLKTTSWLTYLRGYAVKKMVLIEDFGYYFIGFEPDGMKEDLDEFLKNAWKSYLLSIIGVDIERLDLLIDSSFIFKSYVVVDNHVADDRDYSDSQFNNPKAKLFKEEDFKEYFEKNTPVPLEIDETYKHSILRTSAEIVNETLELVKDNNDLLTKSEMIQYKYEGKELMKEIAEANNFGTLNRSKFYLKAKVFLSDIKAAIRKKEESRKSSFL